MSDLTDQLDAQKSLKETVITEKINDCITPETANQLSHTNLPTTTSELEKTNPSSQTSIKSKDIAMVRQLTKKKKGKGLRESKKIRENAQTHEPEKKTEFQTKSTESVNETYNISTLMQNDTVQSEHCIGNIVNENNTPKSDGPKENCSLIVKSIEEYEKPTEILDSLSKLEAKLENKMNSNENKIKTIMCDLEKLISTVDDLKQQTNVEDVKCVNKNSLKDICESRSKKCNADTLVVPDRNRYEMCGNKRCVCKLIEDNKLKAKNIEEINSDNFTLSEFKCLDEKAKQCSLRNDDEKNVTIEPDSFQEPTAQIPCSDVGKVLEKPDQCLTLNDDKTNENDVSGSPQEPTRQFEDKTTQCSMLTDGQKKGLVSNSFQCQIKEDTVQTKHDKTTQYSLINVAQNKSNFSPRPSKPFDCQSKVEKPKDKGNPCSTLEDDKNLKSYASKYLKKCGFCSKEKDENITVPNQSTLLSNYVAAHQCNFPTFM